LIEIDTLF